METHTEQIKVDFSIHKESTLEQRILKKKIDLGLSRI